MVSGSVRFAENFFLPSVYDRWTMKRNTLFAFAALVGFSCTANAQSSLLGQEKRILNMTRSGWAHFREFNGRQLIYFTHLESYRCGIKAVHYSLDGDALDKEWKLQPCDPRNPHSITTNKPYISLPSGRAKSISVQVTFSDGSKSDILRKASDNQVMDKTPSAIESQEQRPRPAQ